MNIKNKVRAFYIALLVLCFICMIFSVAINYLNIPFLFFYLSACYYWVEVYSKIPLKGKCVNTLSAIIKGNTNLKNT